jgi:hypothetical protein
MTIQPNTSRATGPPVVAHRVLLAVLRSPLSRLFGGMCELRFVGRVSGRDIALPVQCAREQDRLVIYVGHAAGKNWWQNFIDGRDVQVRLGGASYLGRGHVVDIEHPERAWAERTYARRFAKVDVARIDPMVIIELAARDDTHGSWSG